MIIIGHKKLRYGANMNYFLQIWRNLPERMYNQHYQKKVIMDDLQNTFRAKRVLLVTSNVDVLYCEPWQHGHRK